MGYFVRIDLSQRDKASERFVTEKDDVGTTEDCPHFEYAKHDESQYEERFESQRREKTERRKKISRLS